MKNKIRAVIFDMDGTLVDSLPIWNEADKRLIEMHGVIRGQALQYCDIIR